MCRKLFRIQEGGFNIITKTEERIEERVFIDAYKNTKENEAYVRHIENVIRLGREIMRRLDGHRCLFLEYERQIGLSEVIYLKNVYQIGLKDGQMRESSGKEVLFYD